MTDQQLFQLALLVFTLLDVLLLGAIYQRYDLFVFTGTTMIVTVILFYIGLTWVFWIVYWLITMFVAVAMSKVHGLKKRFNLLEKIIVLVLTFSFYKLIGAL